MESKADLGLRPQETYSPVTGEITNIFTYQLCCEGEPRVHGIMMTLGGWGSDLV